MIGGIFYVKTYLFLFNILQLEIKHCYNGTK